MKKMIAFMAVVNILTSCMKQSGDEGKVISLNHKVIAGKHCESSAILNALHYQGYEITEEQIIGAGAAPGFVYEKTAFPFLGGRSKNMRESFVKNTGIPFTVRKDSDDPRWNEIEGLLEQGIPVILRVDMRYLPYLYGGKYGPKYMSFGWHLVTLFAMDRQKGTALVTDTEHTSMQMIKLKDLEKARFSRTDVFPPGGEYYWFPPLLETFQPDWPSIAQESLVEYHNNMKEEIRSDQILAGLEGLMNLSAEIRSFSHTQPSYMIQPLLEFHYGCIETNGTGGAAFRTLYAQFLKINLENDNNQHIIRAAEDSEKSWHALADSYKNAAEDFKKSSKEKKIALLENIAIRAEDLYLAEKNFVDVINSHYKL